MKIFTITIALLFIGNVMISQSVGINDNNSLPDPSAMLDVQSLSKGVLIPRMPTAMRVLIGSPATGLMVFDDTTTSFWFYNGSNWVELISDRTSISDEDGDTKVQVEESPDEDKIRMDIGGKEALVIQESSNGAHVFNTAFSSRSLIIGYNAGLNSFQGFNTLLGYEAGELNNLGVKNTFVGFQAGKRNVNADRGVFVGYQSGAFNEGIGNTFMGHQSGYTNSTGYSNTSIGNQAGLLNTIGYRNTNLGEFAGYSLSEGFQNTNLGVSAGYYMTLGENNVFVGRRAGMRNRTGNGNVALGTDALATNLNSGDLGDENTAVGYNAGFNINGGFENILIGAHSGNSIVNVGRNIFLGNYSGFFLNSGTKNIGIGYNAQRNNQSGNGNISLGDSTLMEYDGSNNIAIGSQAGEMNTGNSNIFIGSEAGALSNTANGNIFVGNHSGKRNTSGIYNVFTGGLSGSFNTEGSSNTFYGHATGDRNSLGFSNSFVGAWAGHGNVDGDENTAVGNRSLYGNKDGGMNTALGFEALGNIDQVNNNLIQIGNTALGYRSSDNDLGNYNVSVGSETSAGDQDYNVAVGYTTRTSGSANVAIGFGAISNGSNSIAIGRNSGTSSLLSANSSIAIGTNTSVGGTDNIVLGHNSNTANFSLFDAIAIGNDINLNQPNTIILGDPGNEFMNVGIGTTTPSSKLTVVENTSDGDRIVRVENNGQLVFAAHGNRGVAVGTLLQPPPDGLRVEGFSVFESTIDAESDLNLDGELRIGQISVPPGYVVAVDGKMVCEEVRVQDSGAWPDYVFAADYPLPTITSLKKYIEKEGHLPGVPSAIQVEKEGILLGNMQRILLEKVEEMSLYIIQLEKRIKDLESK